MKADVFSKEQKEIAMMGRQRFVLMNWISSLILSFCFFSHSSTVAQSNPQQNRFEIPAGWTVYRGQSGLIIAHPPGWIVQERGKGVFQA
jgi:hypothetical protein